MEERARQEARLVNDTLWSYVALAATAAVGVLVNLGLARFFGPTTLGVFAQLYAVYVISTQLAVLGVNDSVQKHVAEEHGEGRATGVVVGQGLLLTSMTSACVSLGVAVASRPLALLFASEAVGRGLLIIAPGVFLFSLNKVMFGALNGRRHLRTYAAVQILRALAILGVLLVLVFVEADSHLVGTIFTAAEACLVPVLLLLTRPSLPDFRLGAWFGRHWEFGKHAVANSILLEAHLRIDVLMLSFFLSDEDVGIYSFAALFAEGLYQVPVVIRTVLYPHLVSLIFRGDKCAAAGVMRKSTLVSLALTAASAGTLIVIYPHFAPFFSASFANRGFVVLIVLMAGMTLYASVIPFDQLFLQSGRPGVQSLLMTANVTINVVLNYGLIPALGLVGAATATVISFSLAVTAILAGSWHLLGYRGTVWLHGSRWVSEPG